MPGPGSKFTAKQDRQAQHIAESEQKRGKSKDEAERIGYATVNEHKSANGGVHHR